VDPIRAWIKTDPVRRWIDSSVSSFKRHHGWKKLGIATLIVILICVLLITLIVFLLKSLSTGTRNRDLYLPGRFINRDLYIPRIRRL
jgi:ABC-type Fe3+ transport system permease subunit